MKKLKLSTREIGSVNVFDLEGNPTQDSLQEIAWRIQRKIRRHRMQRVILNLQHLPHLDSLGIRKLLAAFLRPKCSLIYGVSRDLEHLLDESYLPINVHICHNEQEVAEDLGPFLIERDPGKKIPVSIPLPVQESVGYQMERRRAKRMHVAIPAQVIFHLDEGTTFVTRAILSNISEGGLFAEYLDLDEAQRVSKIENLEGHTVDVKISPCSNFPEEYHVTGKITRKEMIKKQLGIGVKFVDES